MKAKEGGTICGAIGASRKRDELGKIQWYKHAIVKPIILYTKINIIFKNLRMKCSNISWAKLQFHVFSLTMGKLDSLLSNSVLMLDGGRGNSCRK